MKDLENLPTLRIRGQIAPKDSFMNLMGGEFCSASDVSKFLQDHKADPELLVEISSDGGYRAEGVEIYQLLKGSGKKITTVAYKANSIATVIMLGGTTRLIAEFAAFIVHFARIDPMNLGMDPLTAEDFQKLADETERADRQILDIYCQELGEDKRTELIAAMADERDLGAKGAIKLGFATGYYKKKKKEAMSVEDFRGALINEHLASLIENKMSDKTEASRLENIIENGFKKISRMFSKIKNEITLTTSDGKQIYLMPANADAPDELVGAKVYEVGEDGLPTETAVADGDYVLDDGRTLVVAAGAVTEVRDAIDVKKLQGDLKEKETALAAANEEIANLKTQMEATKTEMKTQFDAVQNAFTEFKKQVPGDKKDDKKDEGNPDSKTDYSKMTMAQKVRAMSKEREKLDALFKSKA